MPAVCGEAAQQAWIRGTGADALQLHCSSSLALLPLAGLAFWSQLTEPAQPCICSRGPVTLIWMFAEMFVIYVGAVLTAQSAGGLPLERVPGFRWCRF